MSFPIIGGVMTYQGDQDCVYRFNYNNAEALLDLDNTTEKILELAKKYVEKLPYMPSDELDDEYGNSTYGDLSYRYDWACKRKQLMQTLASKYASIGLSAQCKEILGSIEISEELKSLKEQEEQREQTMRAESEKTARLHAETEKGNKAARAAALISKAITPM